jgi:Skp family chaperone for outer membrane proteins
VNNFWLSVAGAVVALSYAVQPAAAQTQGQQGPGWFLPPQSHAAAPARAAGGAPRPAMTAGQPVAAGEEGAAPQIQVQLPPPPEIPPIPKGPPTPAAIVGVVSIPDALRVSSAYHEADKTFTERRKKLDEDAQKEQATLQKLSQELAGERTKLSPEQIRIKERELQDRITESRRKFGERNRIIQEAGQYVMAQINRTLEQVVQAVAISRGINVVLNRAQVLGTTADFDMTPEVAQFVNKVLPAVTIPPDGVSPLSMAVPKTEPGAAEAKKEAPAKAAAKPVKH